MTNAYCPQCNKKFNLGRFQLLQCSQCKVWLEWEQDYLDQQKGKTEESLGGLAQESYSKTAISILDSILVAQVRTVYAIRSLAIFLFTFLSSFSVGLAAVSLGAMSNLNCEYACEYAEGMSFFGYLVIIIGFITALIAGGIVLGMSNPARK